MTFKSTSASPTSPRGFTAMGFAHSLLFRGCFAAILLTATSLVHAQVPLNQLTEGEKRGGWKLAFDGKSFDGWRNFRQGKVSNGWAIKDGAITRVGRAGDIITKKKYKYFELSVEYKISKGGNSGIMFHVSEKGRTSYRSGPEVQIQCNQFGRDPQKAGWLYQLYKPVKPDWAKRFEKQVGYTSPEVVDATKPYGQWNHVYLRVAPKQSEVAVNGISYYYFQLGTADWKKRVAKSKFAKWELFGKAGSGHICFQDHGNTVAFRNIKIRELPEGRFNPNPIDGTLDLKVEQAFPQVKWQGFSGVDDQGRVRPFRPMVLTHANDGSKRTFVATQTGVIHVLTNGQKSKKSQVFLDISKKVQDFKKDDEEGLLGMAFSPDYKKNGEFYVYYSSSKKLRTSFVSRFRVSSDNPNRANPKEEIVIEIPQPFSNHNGGSIVFGKDGYLYIALGDGGGRNDPEEHGQNLNTWMGSILRIDVTKKDKGKGYAVPSTNPFVNRKGAKPEIYAYGFRNIWRLAVDRQTGALFAADVGQDLWEEINIVKPGGNYGWSIREAPFGFANRKKKPVIKPTNPIWEYDHQVGKSITGGFVYRGKKLPQLKGAYIYADYVTGKIWALFYDQKTGKVVRNMKIPSNGIPIISFGEDEDGEIYYMIESVAGKSLYRFVKK